MTEVDLIERITHEWNLWLLLNRLRYLPIFVVTALLYTDKAVRIEQFSGSNVSAD
jgi:hypothetical protein